MRVVDRIAESILIAALLGELVMVLTNVAARVFFNHSFLWSDEVARLVLFLAGDESGFITGAAIPIDGGITAG